MRANCLQQKIGALIGCRINAAAKQGDCMFLMFKNLESDLKVDGSRGTGAPGGIGIVIYSSEKMLETCLRTGWYVLSYF